MHCDGKCYLKKKLKQADPDRKESAPTSTKTESFVAFVLPQRCEAVITQYTEADLRHHVKYTVHFPSVPPTDIFHPPGLIV